MRNRLASSASVRCTEHRSALPARERRNVGGRQGDLHVGGIVAAHGHHPGGPVDARRSEKGCIAGLSRQHRDALVADGRHADGVRVDVDHDDRFAGGREREGDPGSDITQTAHHRVVANEPQPEPAELLAEHHRSALQHRAGRDDRRREASDLQAPVQDIVATGVVEGGQLQGQVQRVEEGSMEAAVGCLLQVTADAQPQKQEPQRGQSEPPVPRVREELHSASRLTMTISTGMSRSSAYRTESAVPPRPRPGCPSQTASTTSLRSTTA